MTDSSPAHRALVTAPFRGEGLGTLRGLAEVVLDPWIDHRPVRLLDGDALAAMVEEVGADILIVESDFVTGTALYDLPLVALGACRGDPNNIDVSQATAKGVPVLRAPGRNADAVAEITVGLLLAATRGIVPADRDVRAGDVYKDGSIPYQRFRGWQLAGRTVGIVGFGAVGRATAWRLAGLGMTVISADPFAPDATHDLDDLVREADVVSMHAAVTPDSVGLMSEARFAAMKPGSVYVNSARAGLHDLDALTAALTSGHLAAAALDHFEGEHLRTDHPLVGMDNVVLTPHIGGASYDTEANHTVLMADGLAALLRGEAPANLANPEVLDRG